MFLKQSTATSIKIGRFVDSIDGVTAETGLTINQADVRLSKNGGDFAQKNDATAAAHDENGYYDCAINITDTGTVGNLQVAITVAGAVPIEQQYIVLPANIYDSLIAGTDLIDTNLTQIGGVAQSATDLKDFADTGYDPTTHKVEDVKIADSVTALGATAKTDVNAEVADVINTDTQAELAAVPAANASLSNKITLLAMACRNGGTNTNTQFKINKDNGTALGTATCSDDGTTFVRGKIA